MFEVPLGTDMVRHIPLIFPDSLVHSEMADAFKQTPGMMKAKPISAGFITFGTLGPECHGHSSSLNLSADEEIDSATIRYMDYLHGLYPAS
jgi:hypothetical protein